MKNILNIVLVFTILIFTSCDKEDAIENQNSLDTSEEFTFTDLNLDLDINLSDYYDFYFKSSNLKSFNDKFLGEFLSQESFYMVSDKDVTIIRISSPDYEKSLHTSDNHYSRVVETVNFETCRSEACVREVIKKAVGESTKTVYIEIKTVTTYGKRTGVQVGYSSEPFNKVVFLDIEKIENTDITNVDDFLEL